ncbi:GPP34 family phosphoprotein [Segeticoccus rhizosphaerae]|jgi:hypothetical protein|uniref:GPP34 family phosphoprotein n=1 Tax=Segeticoccus rhizosphaerae TaxID=1104777 RepID=UPI0010C11803|nr:MULTISPECIES: GPP34 family phosphoprotein [Intrasporangiaceae]
MAELLVAQVLWLLGQDEQLLRPRVGTLRVAITAGALLDVLDSGAAGWAGTDDEPQVRATGVSPSDPLTRAWAARLTQAAPSQPIPVIHAINTLGSGMWEAVGTDLVHRGLAIAVRRPVRRWLTPRHRPDRGATHRARAHLRNVIHGAEPATAQDHGVLAVAWCADVAEHVLSRSAFIDPAVVEPTRVLLEDSALVRRLNEAVSYLVSMAPGLGITPSWPGIGP